MRRRGRKKTVFLLIAGLLIILAAVFFALPAGQIRFDGNAYYSDSEMKSLIFGDEIPRYLPIRVSEWLGRHEKIPFVDHYELSFGEDRSITVRVYEKALAGYLLFQNYYLYFDWDGTLVESSTERIEGLYEVTGLGITHAVVGEKLPVSDEGMLYSILTVSQFLSTQTVRWQGETVPIGQLCRNLRFTADGMSVSLGDISVFLGDSENLEAKLFLMEDILPELEGRSGTLYLDSYRAGSAHPSYVFREKN